MTQVVFTELSDRQRFRNSASCHPGEEHESGLAAGNVGDHVPYKGHQLSQCRDCRQNCTLHLGEGTTLALDT